MSDPHNYLQRELVSYIGRNCPGTKLRVSVPDDADRKSFSLPVTKALNREKPKLFQNYLQRTDVLVVDLLFNNAVEKDIEMIVQAMQKMKEFPSKKKIVVISSLLSWAQTDLQLIEKVNARTGSPSDSKVDEAGQGQGSNEEFAAEQQNKPETLLEPRHFRLRTPTAEFEASKALEDTLAELASLNENLEVHIFYTGLVYGKEQLVLKELFKKAWLGEALPLNQDDELNDFAVPTAEVSWIIESIMRVLDDESLRPEFSDYDRMAQLAEEIKEEEEKVRRSTAQTPLSTQPIPKQQNAAEKTDSDAEIEETDPKHTEEDQQDEQRSDNDNDTPAAAPTNSVEQEEPEAPQKPNGLKVYFLTEPKVLSYRQIIAGLNESLGSGATYEEDGSNFEFPDILLWNFKIAADRVIAQLFSDQPTGFLENLEKSTAEFCKVTNLKPIRVVINSEFNFSLAVAKSVAERYRVPLVSVDKFVTQLWQNQTFLRLAEELVGEEAEWLKRMRGNNQYMESFDFGKDRSQSEFVFKLLKYRLSMNDCLRKGYVLYGFERVFAGFDIKELMYTNKYSKVRFEKEVGVKKRTEIKRIERETRERLKAEERLRRAAERAAQKQEQELQEEDEKKKNQESNELINDDPEAEAQPEAEAEPEQEPADDPEPADEPEPEAEPEPETEEEPSRKEPFFPQHFLLLTQHDELSPGSRQLFVFCTKRSLPVSLRHVDLQGTQEDKKTVPQLAAEISDEFRLYIERVCSQGRPTVQLPRLRSHSP